MPDTVNELLAERGQTHGDFRDVARVTGRLKGVLSDEIVTRLSRGQRPLTQCQRESLDMILHKIGRILAGNADFADHWDDIAGYAKLISKEISRGSEPSSTPQALHFNPVEFIIDSRQAAAIPPIQVAWETPPDDGA